MLQTQLTKLPEERAQRIRNWLRQSEGADFIEVLKGRLAVNQVNIATAILTADFEDGDKNIVEENTIDARFYERMVTILQDIAAGEQELHDTAVSIVPRIIEEPKANE